MSIIIHQLYCSLSTDQRVKLSFSSYRVTIPLMCQGKEKRKGNAVRPGDKRFGETEGRTEHQNGRPYLGKEEEVMGGQRKWSLVCLTLEGNNHSIRHLWPEARGKAKQNRKPFGWKKSFPCLCVSFLDLASAGNVVHRCRGYFPDLCFLTSWASSPHAHQVGILGIMGFCQMGILGTSYPPI